MKQAVVITNPVINSPFGEPQRHFKFDDDGITDQITPGRRPSSYFIPIAQPRKKSKDAQQTFEGWTADRIEENPDINRIRQRVKLWREGGYPDVTRTTNRLLAHWTSPDRSRRLFFCQIEAMETLVYLTEVAKKYGDAWINNKLDAHAAEFNPGLSRVASKMATGSGKTAVMAMLIAWHALNKRIRKGNKSHSRWPKLTENATQGVGIGAFIGTYPCATRGVQPAGGSPARGIDGTPR